MNGTIARAFGKSSEAFPQGDDMRIWDVALSGCWIHSSYPQGGALGCDIVGLSGRLLDGIY